MVGCYEDSIGPEVPVIGGITLSQEQMTVGAEGGEFSVDIYTEYNYQASCNVDWIEILGGSCGADYCTQFFNVKTNTTTSSREGIITIFCEDYNLSATLTISQEANTRHAISFETYPKISVPIAIYAVWDSSASDGKDFYEEYFTNTKFIYDEKSGLYSGDTVKCWPLSGTMQYMALAPYHIYATATNHYNSDGSFEKIEITSIDNNLVNQHDILYSDLLEVSTPQTSAQPLLFHHAYAQLNVTFKKTDSAAEVILKSVKVNDVYINGQLAITPVVGGPSTAEWVVGLPVPRYFLPESATGVEDGTLDATLEAATPFAPQPVLVIPGAQTEIVIECTIDGHEHTYTHDLSWNRNWEMGYKYTYNYIINVNEIIVNCTVEDWNYDTVDGPTIVI